MAYVQILSGELKGKRIDIECDEFSIGRAPENTLPITDPSVSGKHCVILRKGHKYTLKDLGSTNGTTLNEVTIEEFQLSRADAFAAGSVEMKFDGQDVEDAAPMPGDIPATIVTKRPSTRAQGSITGASGGSPFGRKKDAKYGWRIILALIGVLVLAALGFFLVQLLKG